MEDPIRILRWSGSRTCAPLCVALWSPPIPSYCNYQPLISISREGEKGEPIIAIANLSRSQSNRRQGVSLPRDSSKSLFLLFPLSLVTDHRRSPSETVFPIAYGRREQFGYARTSTTKSSKTVESIMSKGGSRVRGTDGSIVATYDRTRDEIRVVSETENVPWLFPVFPVTSLENFPDWSA